MHEIQLEAYGEEKTRNYVQDLLFRIGCDVIHGRMLISYSAKRKGMRLVLRVFEMIIAWYHVLLRTATRFVPSYMDIQMHDVNIRHKQGVMNIYVMYFTDVQRVHKASHPLQYSSSRVRKCDDRRNARMRRDRTHLRDARMDHGEYRCI